MKFKHYVFIGILSITTITDASDDTLILHQIEPLESFSTSDNTTHHNVEFYSDLSAKNWGGRFNGFLVNDYLETEVDGKRRVSFSILNYSPLAGAIAVFDADGNMLEKRPFSGHDGPPTSIIDLKLPSYFFRDNFLSIKSAIEERSIYVDGIPKYNQSKIILYVPNGGTIKLSYTSDEALFFNIYEYAIELILKIAGSNIPSGQKFLYPVNKRQLEALYYSFVKSTALNTTKNGIKNVVGLQPDTFKKIITELIHSLTVAFSEFIIEGDKRTRFGKVAKSAYKKMSLALTGADYALTLGKGAVKWQNYGLLLTKREKNTVYIRYGGEKGKRGFHGGYLGYDSEVEELKFFVQGNIEVDWFAPYFLDITRYDWYTPYINKLRLKGIVKGFPGYTFRPNESVTRAEFIKMVVVAYEIATGKIMLETNHYSGNNWYIKYLNKAKSIKNKLTGESLIYWNPNLSIDFNISITRLEAAKVIFNTSDKDINSFSIDRNLFNDINSLPDSDIRVLKAVSKNGLFQGFNDGTFRTNAPLTRGQATKIICKAMFDKDCSP